MATWNYNTAPDSFKGVIDSAIAKKKASSTDPNQWAWQNLDQPGREQLQQGWQTWQGMPDYRGKHETAQMLYNQYAQMLNRWQQDPKIDYSGAGYVGDQFNNQRDRLQSMLAARGLGGSGIEAGAMANLAGREASSVGDYFRQQMEQRRRERLAQQMEFDRYARGLQAQGLQRNWQQQDDPGFWGDALGFVGGLAGSVIPGLGGVTGLLGGGQKPMPPGYGDQSNWSGYGQAGYYGPGY